MTYNASEAGDDPSVKRTRELADPRSFCAGVERAIEIVERLLRLHGAPIYIRRHTVHNTHVVEGLRAKGAIFVRELEEVPAGATVVLSAHAVAPSVRAEGAKRDLEVVDATCPLVAKVHAEARRFAQRGDTIVLVGQAGHDESTGTLGEAPDQIVLVETAEEAASLALAGRVSYLTRTTLAVDDADTVVDVLQSRFPGIAGPNRKDICYAATNRQNAMRAIAADADIILVLGSVHSHNSRAMVDVARGQGVPAHLIDDASAIDPAWLERVSVVGVSADASAPPILVDQVVERLREFGAVTVRERTVATEDVRFALPRQVRT